MPLCTLWLGPHHIEWDFMTVDHTRMHACTHACMHARTHTHTQTDRQTALSASTNTLLPRKNGSCNNNHVLF